ncbi:MAG: hypothetical protein GTN60_07165, partial [Pseudomonas stutzeri]|nr:hypothetical protein [Stutzerimonas stutzeri]NIO12447.1 hypothetical protein [Xanthomonadales bacterium]NIP00443.1 hypothetical protein [Stutzerimonas stutzeri]NIQ23041.1 hypothetical protein [Stutzerimonas stutzeri]NIT08946.1 hypothetical protein [Xanthomonadales bacterium]
MVHAVELRLDLVLERLDVRRVRVVPADQRVAGRRQPVAAGRTKEEHAVAVLLLGEAVHQLDLLGQHAQPVEGLEHLHGTIEDDAELLA